MPISVLILSFEIFLLKKIYKFTLAVVDKREMDWVKFIGLESKVSYPFIHPHVHMYYMRTWLIKYHR